MPLDLPSRVSVEAPENVEFSFEVAGIGSRGIATLVDSLILSGIYLFLGVTATLLGVLGLALPGTMWVLALTLIAFFAVPWVYFVAFETRWNGQTPGKRAAGIRVVREEGVGITFFDAALRNILRGVDFLPFFYGVGLIVMFLHPKSRRLGDLVAGTLVVKERKYALLDFGSLEELAAPQRDDLLGAALLKVRLSVHEYEAFSDFLARAGSMDATVRARLALSLLTPLLERAGVEPTSAGALSAEEAEGLLRRRMGTAGTPSTRAFSGPSLYRFVAGRRDAWTELEALLDRTARGRLAGFSHVELRRFGALYRQATADYAYARTHFPGSDLSLYLNQLVARGHNLVYQRRPLGLRSVFDFFASDFPRTFRAEARYFLGALGLFLAGLFLGLVSASLDEEVGYLLLSPEMMEDYLRQSKLWTSGLLNVLPSSILSATILTNNIAVGLLVFASGVALGAGPTYLLFLNGMMLGVVASLSWKYHIAGGLGTFVAAHGPLELTAIWIAGGAGLILGDALLHPGDLPRGLALRQRGRVAVKLVLGMLPLLVVAGQIEGHISPAEGIPWWAKVAVGVATGCGLYGWLLTGGRRGQAAGPL